MSKTPIEPTLLRCANWKADPDTCGENCGIQFDQPWHVAVARVFAMEHRGWVYLEYMREGVRYRLPFCAMRCLTAWNDRMVAEHEGGLTHVHPPSESEAAG